MQGWLDLGYIHYNGFHVIKGIDCAYTFFIFQEECYITKLLATIHAPQLYQRDSVGGWGRRRHLDSNCARLKINPDERERF